MKNFIKAMLKSKVNHKNENMGIRLFNHINTNSGYRLSIQCSEYHYCTPKKLLGIKYYDTFELAILKDNEFIYPNILENFHRKDELDECYEGTVFGYVPKDLVEDLYNYLNSFN